METKNKDMEKERKLPIFEDYEMVENGKAVQKWMLSLNGMYISGISKEQLKLLHGAVLKTLYPGISKEQLDAALAALDKKDVSSK